MARPMGGNELAAEIRGLADGGVNVLVSLLSDEEIAESGLAGEQATAEAAGLTFLQLQTSDLHVPERDDVLAMARTLRSRLDEGASVVVHCHAGIGRSSTLAAAVLLLEGLPPDRAWNQITAARGVQVPDTPAQRQFIETLARTI
jgi:protein-tyrosine phosphatase